MLHLLVLIYRDFSREPGSNYICMRFPRDHIFCHSQYRKYILIGQAQWVVSHPLMEHILFSAMNNTVSYREHSKQLKRKYLPDESLKLSKICLPSVMLFVVIL